MNTAVITASSTEHWAERYGLDTTDLKVPRGLKLLKLKGTVFRAPLFILARKYYHEHGLHISDTAIWLAATALERTNVKQSTYVTLRMKEAALGSVCLEAHMNFSTRDLADAVTVLGFMCDTHHHGHGYSSVLGSAIGIAMKRQTCTQ